MNYFRSAYWNRSSSYQENWCLARLKRPVDADGRLALEETKRHIDELKRDFCYKKSMILHDLFISDSNQSRTNIFHWYQLIEILPSTKPWLECFNFDFVQNPERPAAHTESQDDGAFPAKRFPEMKSTKNSSCHFIYKIQIELFFETPNS